jgi:hypothetical protein
MAGDNQIPALARQNYAVLKEIAKHLSPDDRARLRTMSGSHLPISFWKLLAYAPAAHTDSDPCTEVWKVILGGMGYIGHGKLSFGRILSMTEFPESRVSRLLEASGTSLPGLLNEAVRWLVSHDVRYADFSTALTFGLADALGEREARSWARRTIALDYCRRFGRGYRASADKQSEAPAQQEA